MSWTKVNQGLQTLSVETETSAKFNQLEPRLYKLEWEINRG